MLNPVFVNRSEIYNKIIKLRFERYLLKEYNLKLFSKSDSFRIYILENSENVQTIHR